MPLRQSFLTKRYGNVFYFDHGTRTHIHDMYLHVRIHGWYIWAAVCQSQHEVKAITVCQAFIMNLDEKGSQTSQNKRASGC